MKKKEKQLRIKDICARLLDGVKVDYNGELYDVLGYTNGKLIIVKPLMSNAIGVEVEKCKPYLRPLYSMTEEEARFILKIILGDQKVYDVNVTKDGIEAYVDDGVASFERTYVFHNEIARSLDIFDYVTKLHFDLRGLIPMGLALPAKEDTYRNYGTSEKHI